MAAWARQLIGAAGAACLSAAASAAPATGAPGSGAPPISNPASYLARSKRPPSFAAANTAAAHRIRLPATVAQVHLSQLRGTLELRGRDGRPVQAVIPAMAATPCAMIDVPKLAAYHCSTAQLEATLVDAGGQRFLDLRELRGLPASPIEDGPAELPYPPEELGLGGPCPGTTAASRGECFYQQGRFHEAEIELTDALEDPEAQRYAGIRLGDLALQRRDFDGALGFWKPASGPGPWGRLATARIVDLTGIGLQHDRIEAFDSAALPDRLRSEMRFRRLRAYALLRRWKDAMELASELAPNECWMAPRQLCERVLLAGFFERSAPHDLALEAYLRLQGHTTGAFAPELARGAALACEEIGTPAYGATLLSVTARRTPLEDLQGHLRKAFDLYVMAGDPIRAGVIAEYARARLPRPPEWEMPVPFDVSPEAVPALAEAERTEAWLAVVTSTLQRARLIAPWVRP